MKPLTASIRREFHSLTQTLPAAVGKWSLVALGFLLFQNAQATLYLLEPFDYPAGPLTNALPWSTNGTAVEAGTPTLQLVSGDFSYSPLTDPAPVNHVKLQYSNNVKGIRQIPGGPLGDPSAGGTVYVSFIFYKATTNGTTANAPIVGVNVNTTETINQAAVNGMVLYHQQSGGVGNYHLGIKVGGGTTGMIYPPGTQVYASGNTSTGDVGQTNFIVMKYTFVSGAGNDTVALWVNPDASSFGGAEPAATTNDVAETAVAGATDAIAGLSYFQIRGGASGAAGTIQLDNIRVASTWAEVAPTCISAGTTDPANQSVSPGQTATFSVTGSGLNPTYQWQTNHGGPFVDITGATSSSYTTPAEVLGDNGEQFRCVVNVACNGSSVTSAVATLTVQTCVAAGVTDPANQTVDAGQTATFSVTGTGTSRTYQWQTNNGAGWVNVSRSDQFELHNGDGAGSERGSAISLRRQRRLRWWFFRDLGSGNAPCGLHHRGRHEPAKSNRGSRSNRDVLHQRQRFQPNISMGDEQRRRIYQHPRRDQFDLHHRADSGRGLWPAVPMHGQRRLRRLFRHLSRGKFGGEL